MNIKQITPDDYEDLFKIRTEALREAPDAFGATLEQTLEEGAQSFKDKIHTDGNGAIFIAYDTDTPVGMAGIFRQIGIKRKHLGFVWGVFVSSKARGNGLGRLLMEAIISFAKEHSDIERLNLSVQTDNKEAFDLYQKLGFSNYGTEKDAFKFNGEYSDIYQMTLKLDPL